MTVVPQGKRALGQPFVHAPLAAVALLLIAASFGFDSYRGFVVLTLVVYAISAIGLNMSIGFSGVLSIGHGASFAVGTYASAVLSGEHQLPYWVSLPAALGCGVVAGLIMAAPAARLGGLGLAMVSLGFTLILADVIREFEFITKGRRALPGSARSCRSTAPTATSATKDCARSPSWCWWWRTSPTGTSAIRASGGQPSQRRTTRSAPRQPGSRPTGCN